MTDVFIRPCENTGARGEPQVMMETETGVICLQGKDFWQPPEARRKTLTDPPLKPPEGTNAADILILDFWPPDL